MALRDYRFSASVRSVDNSPKTVEANGEWTALPPESADFLVIRSTREPGQTVSLINSERELICSFWNTLRRW